MKLPRHNFEYLLVELPYKNHSQVKAFTCILSGNSGSYYLNVWICSGEMDFYQFVRAWYRYDLQLSGHGLGDLKWALSFWILKNTAYLWPWIGKILSEFPCFELYAFLWGKTCFDVATYAQFGRFLLWKVILIDTNIKLY